MPADAPALARPRRLLVVEDNEDHALLIERAFSDMPDYELEVVSDLAAARLRLAQDATDVVLADLNLPDGQATELLLADDSQPPIIVMTSHGDESLAVNAMKKGAIDYVVKTADSLQNMARVVQRAEREIQLIAKRRSAERALAAKTQELQSMNERLCDLMGVAKHLTSATDEESCMRIFVDKLSVALAGPEGPASCERIDLTTHPICSALHETGKMALARGAPAACTVGSHAVLLVPIDSPPTKGVSGVCVRRSATTPFAAGDLTIGELLTSFLAEVLRTQRAARDFRESQNMLQQAEKMKSLGQLAGGLAHDLNNMLMAIMGATELLQRRVDQTCPDANEYVDLVLEASQRASDLTKKVLTYSRRSPLSTEHLRARDIVSTVAELLRHTVDRRIRIVVEHSPRPCSVLADATALQNALLNVCLNARDAMPDGGKMTITTEVVAIDEVVRQIHVPVGAPGGYVCIRVADSGGGMGEEVMHQVFDPFFTTKPPESGTGLGMSVVYGTMQEHGGGVVLESEVGRGTTCKLFLPLSEMAGKATAGDEPPPETQETLSILLAEDERMLRATTARLLRSSGHAVEVVSDGKEVVEIVAQGGKRFDVLVLDVMMPDVSGLEAHRQLRAAGISLPTVFLSGFGEQGEIHEAVRDPWCTFVQKPSPVRELEAAIHRCLSASRGGDTARR